MDNDDITITLSGILDTITYPSTPNTGDVWINSSDMQTKVYTTDNTWINIGDITADTIDLNSITISEPVEFEDTMPSVAKIEDMCKDYPALEKAYENFKTIYAMVHQDWQGRQDDEDDWPF